jgi:catechol 2,3-dioxygenase-like lactoylglutathione lyase family enzyme
MAQTKNLPSRLHHTAYVTKDQEKTRQFYEDIIGLPFVLEHGYCRSVYVTDPNGLILEFTRDHPDVEKIGRARRADAHQSLKRWLAGDHTSNNTYR